MRAYRLFVATLTSLALVVQAPLSALAAGADFAPATNDDIARRCDALAAPRSDPQYSERAQSLFVKATLSPDPRFAHQARENLAAMLHHPPPARDRDDTTAAVVGVALVGLALLWAFSGSGESSGGSGSGGGMPTNTGVTPFGGGSPSTSNRATSPFPTPVSTPMTGNITKILNGQDAMSSTGVNRR